MSVRWKVSGALATATNTPACSSRRRRARGRVVLRRPTDRIKADPAGERDPGAPKRAERAGPAGKGDLQPGGPGQVLVESPAVVPPQPRPPEPGGPRRGLGRPKDRVRVLREGDVEAPGEVRQGVVEHGETGRDHGTDEDHEGGDPHDPRQDPFSVDPEVVPDPARVHELLDRME